MLEWCGRFEDLETRALVPAIGNNGEPIIQDLEESVRDHESRTLQFFIHALVYHWHQYSIEGMDGDVHHS